MITAVLVLRECVLFVDAEKGCKSTIGDEQWNVRLVVEDSTGES